MVSINRDVKVCLNRPLYQAQVAISHQIVEVAGDLVDSQDMQVTAGPVFQNLSCDGFVPCCDLLGRCQTLVMIFEVLLADS